MKGIRKKTAFAFTGILGALGVGLGAFGAHGLEDLLVESGRVGTWETAAFYHLVHSVVLLVLVSCKVWRPWCWTAFAAGILIFSGSLYLLCLTQTSWLGAVTPIGGVLFIAGWAGLSISAK
jgi:uncharacterized membrane protein YgdD (TMEM256/DUF423 family)